MNLTDVISIKRFSTPKIDGLAKTIFSRETGKNAKGKTAIFLMVSFAVVASLRETQAFYAAIKVGAMLFNRAVDHQPP